MDNVFPISGSWWLPNNYRKRIIGILFHDDLYGLCLKLNGHLFEENKLKEMFGGPIPFVLGRSTSSEEITLRDIALISYSNTGSTYKVHSNYIGQHFRNPNDVRFNVMKFPYTYFK